jgi:hypothetical protein
VGLTPATSPPWMAAHIPYDFETSTKGNDIEHLTHRRPCGDPARRLAFFGEDSERVSHKRGCALSTPTSAVYLGAACDGGPVADEALTGCRPHRELFGKSRHASSWLDMRIG